VLDDDSVDEHLQLAGRNRVQLDGVRLALLLRRPSRQVPGGDLPLRDGELFRGDRRPVRVRVWVGVDVGGERADSAVVYDNAQLHVGVETWSGDDAILEVVAFVSELADRFHIVEAVFDPWRAGQMSQESEQRGIVAVSFPQSDSRMIPAPERLYNAVVHQRLVHLDDAELNAHVHAAVAKHSPARLEARQGQPLLQDRRRRRARHAVDRQAHQPEPVRLVAWL
jgi:hypothetical protein